MVGLLAAYLLVSAVLIRQTTGVLQVKSGDSRALLSVTATSRQAQIIGTGSARVRLAPGTYQVSANHDGKQDTALVKITKKSVTSVTVNPIKSPKLPSVGDISFLGTNALINSGLTSGQVQTLKREFFQFAPAAETVIIQAATISPGPRDLSNASSDFTMTFSVDIGSQTYKARIAYGFSDDISLVLSSADGHQVFDSARPSS